MRYISATIATQKVTTFATHEAAVVPLPLIIRIVVVIIWYLIHGHIFIIRRLFFVRWYLLLFRRATSSRFLYFFRWFFILARATSSRFLNTLFEGCFLLTIGRIIFIIVIFLEILLIALLLPCHSIHWYNLFLLLNWLTTLWLLLLHVLILFSLLFFNLIFDLSLKELTVYSFQNAYCHGQGEDVVVGYFLEDVVPPRGTETFGGPILEKLEHYDLHIFISLITFLFLRNFRFFLFVRIKYLFRAILLVLLLH